MKKISPKKKAKELIDKYRIILMNKDTDCGNEILCTTIAIECAIVDVANTIDSRPYFPNTIKYTDCPRDYFDEATEYWQKVIHELAKLR